MQQFGNYVQNSEVARIRQQIQAEQESAQRAQQSFAYGAAQHKFITARYERMGMLHDRLEELVGEEADIVLVRAMEGF